VDEEPPRANMTKEQLLEAWKARAQVYRRRIDRVNDQVLRALLGCLLKASRCWRCSEGMTSARRGRWRWETCGKR